MKIKTEYWIKLIIPPLAGGALGFCYYYFIGCTTGSCPIQSNPYLSTFYGALVGLVLAVPRKKKA